MLLAPDYTLRTATLELHKKHIEPLLPYNSERYGQTCQVPNGLNPLVLMISLKIHSPIKSAVQNDASSRLSGGVGVNLGNYSQRWWHDHVASALACFIQTSFETGRLLLSRAPEKSFFIL